MIPPHRWPPNPLPALAYAGYDHAAAQPVPGCRHGPHQPTPVDPPATVGTPDPVNGVVTGSLNFTGTNLTYTVTTPPTNGAVTVDTAGNFTYTPTLAARAAAANPGAPTTATQDNFTVTASNNAGSAPETVTVPVSPISAANVPNTTDTDTPTDPLAPAADPPANPLAALADGIGGFVNTTVSGLSTIGSNILNGAIGSGINTTVAGLTTLYPDAVKFLANLVPSPQTQNTVSNVATITLVGTAVVLALPVEGAVVGAAIIVDVGVAAILGTLAFPTGANAPAASNPIVAVVGVIASLPSTIEALQNVVNNIGTNLGNDTITSLNNLLSILTNLTNVFSVLNGNTGGNTGGNTEQRRRKHRRQHRWKHQRRHRRHRREHPRHTGGRKIYVIGNPNPTTGQVTGTATFTDPGKQTLTYTVSTQATNGMATVNSATGAFDYTPTNTADDTAAARLNAGTNPDTFRVIATNTSGNAAGETITIPAINGLKLEVTNTIPVGSQIDALAVSPNGATVYVVDDNAQAAAAAGYAGTAADGWVSVINTATNTATATIPVGVLPDAVTISPNGSQVYVGNEDEHGVGDQHRHQHRHQHHPRRQRCGRGGGQPQRPTRLRHRRNHSGTPTSVGDRHRHQHRHRHHPPLAGQPTAWARWPSAPTANSPTSPKTAASPPRWR